MEKLLKNRFINKIYRLIKKYDLIFVFLTIFLINLGNALGEPFYVCDELYNFSNCFKMSQGFIPYIDTNLIITPLLFYIVSCIFSVFGANYLVSRIVHIFIVSFVGLFFYIVLKKLIKHETTSYLATLFLLFFEEFYLVREGINYTVFGYLICLIGILLVLNREKIKGYNLIQGILVFLLFMTKQNMGVLYGLALFINELYSYRDIKYGKKISNILVWGITFVVLLTISAFILYKLGILEGLINYCFLGMNEFGSENFLIGEKGLFILIPIIEVEIALLVLEHFLFKYKKLNITDKQKEQLRIIKVFSYIMFLTVIPIINLPHVVSALIIYGIRLVFVPVLFIDTGFERKNEYSKIDYIIKDITLVMLIITMFISIKNVKAYLSYMFDDSIEKVEASSPYYGVIIPEEGVSMLKNVTEYIKNCKDEVLIISDHANIYMNELRKSNGIYDLPLEGNLGKDGEQGLINNLRKLHNDGNTQFMILDDEDNVINYQLPENVINVIKNEFEYIGNIECFLIYK